MRSCQASGAASVKPLRAPTIARSGHAAGTRAKWALTKSGGMVLSAPSGLMTKPISIGGETHPVTTVKAEFEAVRKTKVYEQVAKQIERLIAEGLLKPGDKLPPERELAETFQVSRRDRKSTRLNSSHIQKSRMPSSA